MMLVINSQNTNCFRKNDWEMFLKSSRHKSFKDSEGYFLMESKLFVHFSINNLR